MKRIYSFGIRKLALILFITLLPWQNTTGQTYNFTNASATGPKGPTQVAVTSAYSGTTLAGQVTVLGDGIQQWTVPRTGLYTIKAAGGSGGGPNAGKGAIIEGEFMLNSGTVLKILVGQEGIDLTTNRFDYSGGGGSFVTNASNTPLVVAGGGGGAMTYNPVSDGNITTTGGTGAGGTSFGIGGTGGMGGGSGNQTTDGGAGLIGNGTSGNPSPAPQSFINGGHGGVNTWSGGCPACGADGGFGGGGGVNRYSTTFYGMGGGGGYSGGGSAYGNGAYAGGGGSFNAGTNQINLPGANTGHGWVTINGLSTGATNDVGIVSIDSPAVICEGTHNVVATISNFGANQVDNVTVQWAVDGIAQAPVAYNGLLDTFGGVGSVTGQVLLGSFTFAGGTYAIKAWTSMPNGVADTVNLNDTMGVNKVAHPNPTVNLGNDTVFCQGAIAFLILNAGNPGSTYLWHDNAAGSQYIVTGPGTYWVRVTSAQGCVGRDTFVATTAPSPVVSIDDTIVCEGALIVLDAGNPGSTYVWSDNSTTQTLAVTATGLYQVTVTNQHGCKDDDLAVVTINPNPLVDLGNDTLTHTGAEVTLDAGNPGATYLWNTGATTQTITVSAHGTYSVTVTDANDCEGTDTFTNEPNSIHTVDGLGRWSVFPNPTNGDTHIRLELTRGGKVAIELYDPSGRRVWGQSYSKASGTETISIPMQGLAQGMYLLRVRLDGQLIGTSAVGKY